MTPNAKPAAVRAAWLVPNMKTSQPQELLSTEMASSRLRAAVCMEALQEAGVQVLPPNLIDCADVPQVLFMSKYVHDSGANLYLHDGGTRWAYWDDTIRRLKSQGTRLVIDYTDHHWAGQDIRTKWYQHILPHVDGVVVPSEQMERNAREYWQGPLWRIPEPLEVPTLAPRALAAGQPLQAVWYGHNSNLPYLGRLVAGALRNMPPMHITVLTNFMGAQDFERLKAQAPSGTTLQLVKWTVPAMVEAASKAHVALIPSDTNDPRKNGASNNRAVTALALGLVPVATMIDSYKPFAPLMVEAEQVRSISDFFAAWGPAQARLSLGQAAAVAPYQRVHVKRQWLPVAVEMVRAFRAGTASR
jgi:hypothetical protein